MNLLPDLVLWLREQYDFLATPEVSLIRSYTNDVYLVGQGDHKFVLKIYGRGWRTSDEIRYEIELIDHLSQAGVSVARVIGGNEALKTLDSRFAVLFEYAAGEKPQPPFSNDLYVRFGQAIARTHRFSDDFVAHHPRKAIDLAYLIDEPLKIILPLLDQPAEFLDTATQLKRRIAAFPALDWGAVHGDATLDNLHVTDAGEIILYDFDSGGPGWRALDLQGWAVYHPEYREKCDSFLKGYASVRPVHEQDLQSSPLLALALEIWGMKVELEKRISPDEARAYAAEQVMRVIAQMSRVK